MSKRKIVAAAGAALALATGGAAIAATRDWSPQEESKAVIDDAAKQLGVSSDKLSSALKQALVNRVDAALAAGRITNEQADAMKERIQAGEVPLIAGPGMFGHHGGPPHGFFGDLSAAATYLGITEDALRTQLEDGKTLADVAKAQGKPVDGLVDTLVAEAKKHLDAGVAAGRLTQADADDALAEIKGRITDLVNGTGPDGPPRAMHGFGFRDNAAGPPAGFGGPI